MYSITMDDLLKADDGIVIDIRKKEDYDKETWKDAINIYWEEFNDHIDEIPKDKKIYLICYSGEKSDDLAEEFQDKGYDMYSLEGGYRSVLRYKIKEFMKDSTEVDHRCKDIENSIIKKFRKEIWCKFTKAINEYELIKDNDKIAVCISGGKDSMLMAKLFQELRRHGKKNFEVVFLVMDPGYNYINYQTIVDNSKMLEVGFYGHTKAGHLIFKTEYRWSVV